MAEAGRAGEAPLPVTDAGERGENAGVVLKEPFVARGGVAGATSGAAILMSILLRADGGADEPVDTGTRRTTNRQLAQGDGPAGSSVLTYPVKRGNEQQRTLLCVLVCARRGSESSVRSEPAICSNGKC